MYSFSKVCKHNVIYYCYVICDVIFNAMGFQIMFQPSNNRVSIRKDRVFWGGRSHPLDIYNDAELIRRYRMPRHCILDLIHTNWLRASNDEISQNPCITTDICSAPLLCDRLISTGIYMNNTNRNVSRYLHVLITFCQ